MFAETVLKRRDFHLHELRPVVFTNCRNIAPNGIHFWRVFMKKSKGFTLVELIVVIAVIGILLLLAVPKFTSMMSAANSAAGEYNARIIHDYALLAREVHPEIPVLGNSWATSSISSTTFAIKNLTDNPTIGDASRQFLATSISPQLFLGLWKSDEVFAILSYQNNELLSTVLVSVNGGVPDYTHCAKFPTDGICDPVVQALIDAANS